MTLEPLKRYCVHYPDQEQVDRDRLLLANRPKRWRHSAAALALCALAASQLSGCQQAQGRKMNLAPIFKSSVSSDWSEPAVTSLALRRQGAALVPLGNGFDFFHQTNEESALAIIQAALEERGLSSEVTEKTVELPGGEAESATWIFDLSIQGAKEPVYAEFMDISDRSALHELYGENDLDELPGTKKSAVELRKKLRGVRDESTGVVFYMNHEESTQLELREQVEEFVAWMKTTGLI